MYPTERAVSTVVPVWRPARRIARPQAIVLAFNPLAREARMRRLLSAGFLTLTLALFAGCSEQESQAPTEPQFKPGNNKVSYDCDAYGLLEQLDAVNEATEAILMHRPT
ncbi:MAG: hypothetical protein M8867_10330, partial [marine benthic group bacterium]|nr:hypothetical protein [Gemmatimonadota bacterium]